MNRPKATDTTVEEDRILRVAMPLFLRSVLIVAMLMLTSGLVLIASQSPALYVQRYHLARAGRLYEHQTFFELAHAALHGDAYGLLTMGLFTLTLVPLGRVTFCFLLFVKEHDYVYVALTAYVLLGLALGMYLGGVG